MEATDIWNWVGKKDAQRCPHSQCEAGGEDHTSISSTANGRQTNMMQSELIIL